MGQANDESSGYDYVPTAEDDFGIRLRQERERRGWTQAFVADKLAACGIYLHPSAIAKIEDRDAERPRTIRLSEAQAIAGIFELNLDDMLRPRAEVQSIELNEAMTEVVHRYEQLRRARMELNSHERAVAVARNEHRKAVQRYHEARVKLGPDAPRLPVYIEQGGRRRRGAADRQRPGSMPSEWWDENVVDPSRLDQMVLVTERDGTSYVVDVEEPDMEKLD